MADATNVLEIVIQAKDNASRVLRDVSDNAGKLGGDLQSLASKSIAGLAAGFATASGALIYMTSQFAESQEVALQLDQACP
jgi:hypothetical protein